eukprot:6656533-Pyramimonas_sp.AAC.1
MDKWEYMHQVSINRVREGIPLINAKYFFCLEIDWHYVNQLGFDKVCVYEYDLWLCLVQDGAWKYNRKQRGKGIGLLLA